MANITSEIEVRKYGIHRGYFNRFDLYKIIIDLFNIRIRVVFKKTHFLSFFLQKFFFNSLH